jgi:CHAT domain-containing protein/tetratricopeptide (TPR) repeat protein
MEGVSCKRFSASLSLKVKEEPMKSSTMKRILHALVVISLCLQCRSMTTAQIPPSTPDPREVAAKKDVDEGFTLIELGTAEALRAAIGKFENARAIFRETKNQTGEAQALLGLGRISDRVNKKQQALAYYNQALSLVRAVGSKTGEAATLNNIGTVYSDLGEKQKALEYYNQSLALYRAVGNKRGEALSLNNIGAVYETIGEKQKALESYNQILPLYRAIGNRAGEALTLNNIGTIYYSTSENQKALEHYNQALSLRRAVGDRDGEATTLSNIGSISSATGEKQKALEYFNQALSLHRAVGNKGGEVTTLVNIGGLYNDVGEKQKALEYFNQALLFFKAVGDKKGEATTLNNIGSCYYSIGEKQKALDCFNQALPLYRAVGNRSGEATTLNNIGGVTSAFGENQKALEYYNQALVLRRAIGDRDGEATALSNIGLLYSSLGEQRKALDHYHQALPLRRAVGNRRGEAGTLNNIGGAYNELGEKQKALEYYNQALPIFKAVGEKRGEATTLNNIAGITSDLGEKQKALEYYNQALALHRSIGDREGEAMALSNIGAVYFTIGEKQKTLEYYNQALPLSRAVGVRHGEAKMLNNLMRFWQEQKNPRFAIYYGKQAINILQQLRADIQGLDKETQQTFLKSVESNYRYLADILIAQGRIPEAEQVLGMLKDEEFVQFVRRSGDVVERLRQRTDLNDLERKALAEYSKYGDRLTVIGNRLGELDKERLKFPPDAFPQQAEYDQLELQLEDARRVFLVFLRELATEFGKSNEKVRQIESSLQADLKGWGANNVVVISTIAGEERLNLILTTSSTQKAYTTEIKAADLSKLVQKFRAVANDPNTKYDPRPLGRRLYNVLVKPLEKDLEGAQADTLLWSLDGTLRYAPMAALWDGKQYLAERYRNVVITLASRSRIGGALAGSKTEWQALAAGVSTKWPGFAELTAVPEELRSIVRDTGGQNPAERNGVLGGQRLLDKQFTMTSFKRALGRYPLIHIASHFRFRPGNETDSFLLLGDGDRLTLDKVRTAGSMFAGVELLTLSACETATGDTGSNGAEVESFGVVAQDQGAKAVLGTLWPVADVSTRDLMVTFYQTYSTNPNLNKAEALRQAQLSLLRGAQSQAGPKDAEARADISTPANGTQPLFQKDPAKPFAHPYYWAPFILIGNWR